MQQPQLQPYQRAANGIVRFVKTLFGAIAVLLAIMYLINPDPEAPLLADGAKAWGVVALLVAGLWYFGKRAGGVR